MGLPIANLQDAGSMGGKAMGSTIGKLVGSFAGILLIIKLVSESFFFVPIGFRGVLMHGGQPIKRRSGKQVGPIFVKWLGPRTGPYKIKYKGVGVKIPFYTTVEKVNIQERTQVLRQVIADCPDGQRKFDAELITRIPCELDGAEYADFPARVVITSSEPDQIFESYARAALRKVLKVATTDERDDEEWMTKSIDQKAGKKFDRVGYRLLDVTLGEDSLTPAAVVARYFSPKWEVYHPEEVTRPEPPVDTDNVVSLPHPIVLVAAGIDIDRAGTS